MRATALSRSCWRRLVIAGLLLDLPKSEPSPAQTPLAAGAAARDAALRGARRAPQSRRGTARRAAQALTAPESPQGPLHATVSAVKHGARFHYQVNAKGADHAEHCHITRFSR